VKNVSQATESRPLEIVIQDSVFLVRMILLTLLVTSMIATKLLLYRTIKSGPIPECRLRAFYVRKMEHHFKSMDHFLLVILSIKM
jgi:hypothetical protein